MKLASLKSGRDGQLVVVSDDLAWYAEAGHIAATLQDALDDWANLSPRLENLATDLAHVVIPKFRFHEREAASPLPRAFQFVAGESSEQQSSAGFCGPRESIKLADAAGEVTIHAGIIVITDDVPMGVSPESAATHIVLIGLANAVGLAGQELANTLSPVFVTPDTLGDQWQGSTLLGGLSIDVNGAPFARGDSGGAVAVDFAPLISNAAKVRRLGAGTLIGSASVVETPPIRHGDSVRMWMDDGKHHPIFGVIEQQMSHP